MKTLLLLLTIVGVALSARGVAHWDSSFVLPYVWLSEGYQVLLGGAIVFCGIGSLLQLRRA